METKDVRWVQRLSSFERALAQLKEAVVLSDTRELSNLEKQGLIHAFEFTHELAWNVLKDFLEDRGNRDIYGSRDATREAVKFGILINGDIWMDMIASRNRSSHTYDQATSNEIVKQVILQYLPEYEKLVEKMHQLKREEYQA